MAAKHINICNNEQIHHAFLISGSKGIGKSLLIESLAEKILNNKISLENNPDFHNLKIIEEKKLIRKNEILNTIADIYLAEKELGWFPIYDFKAVSYTHLTLPTKRIV